MYSLYSLAKYNLKHKIFNYRKSIYFCRELTIISSSYKNCIHFFNLLWDKAPKKYKEMFYFVLFHVVILLFFNCVYKLIWKRWKWANKNAPYVSASICKFGFWKNRFCSQLFFSKTDHSSFKPNHFPRQC